MPELKHKVHEKFCWLVCEGKNFTEAFRILNPDAKFPGQMGTQIAARPEVKERIAEIRFEIDTRSVLKICRKRELLRQMAEGVTPTKVIRKANGKVEAIFDRHLALVTDAKIAGEFAPEKMEVSGGPTLRLVFDSFGRNTKLPKALEEGIIDITPEEIIDGEPAAVELDEMPEAMPDDYSKYENVELNPKDDVSLEALLEESVVSNDQLIQVAQEQ